MQGEFEAEIERIEDELRSQAQPRALPAPGERLEAKDRPVYVISIAAELVDMHPQTLRLYERKQLIRPGRSSGKTRLYSERDIEHLREIRRLTQELGVNLAGVEEIMRLRHELDGARSHLETNVRRIQDDITQRMTSWRTLPAGEADSGEPGNPEHPEDADPDRD
jgi:MerR family transcriptional regulator/heat shock protein HspR